MDIVIFVLTGALAGWLAGKIMRGGGFGILWNIILGILGAFVGSWLLGTLGIQLLSGWLNTLVEALIGALVVLFIVGLIKKK